MQQKRKKYDSRDRLIQHAIEIFDLVDLDADADPGEPVRRRFTGSTVSRVKRFDSTKRAGAHMAVSS